MNTPTLFDQLDQQLFSTIKPSLTVQHNRHKGNNQILQENREHFNNQTQIVLDHLKKGERVSGLRMMREHGIQDVRARIYTIKKAGYVVHEAKVKGGHGAKEWWITNDFNT